MKIPFSATYGPRAHLEFQFGTGAGPYSANVIIYIDNVVVQDATAPDKAVLLDFNWPEECVADNSWGSGPPVWSQDTTLHADGSMKEVVNYGSGNTGWQDAPGEFHDFPAPYDISKFTYVDFDLYLDAPTGLPSYGQYELASWYGWSDMAITPLSSANVGTWTHYSFALPASVGNCQGVVFHPGGNNMSGVFTYYIDNIAFWNPATPPTAQEAGEGGPKMACKSRWTPMGPSISAKASRTPTGLLPFSWAVQGSYPVSYSFTIANFPDAVSSPRLRGAHVPRQQTIPAQRMGTRLTAGLTGTRLTWSSSSRERHRGRRHRHIELEDRVARRELLAGRALHPVVDARADCGRTVDTDLHQRYHAGTMTGPGILGKLHAACGRSQQFDPNVTGLLSFVQFGMCQNDTAADKHNNNVSGVFGEIK